MGERRGGDPEGTERKERGSDSIRRTGIEMTRIAWHTDKHVNTAGILTKVANKNSHTDWPPGQFLPMHGIRVDVSSLFLPLFLPTSDHVARKNTVLSFPDFRFLNSPPHMYCESCLTTAYYSYHVPTSAQSTWSTWTCTLKEYIDVRYMIRCLLLHFQ